MQILLIGKKCFNLEKWICPKRFAYQHTVGEEVRPPFAGIILIRFYGTLSVALYWCNTPGSCKSKVAVSYLYLVVVTFFYRIRTVVVLESYF